MSEFLFGWLLVCLLPSTSFGDKQTKNRLCRVPASKRLHSTQLKLLTNWLCQPFQSLPRFKIKNSNYNLLFIFTYLQLSICYHIKKSLNQIKNITNNNNSQSTDRNKNSQQFWLDCLAQHNHTWKT